MRLASLSLTKVGSGVNESPFIDFAKSCTRSKASSIVNRPNQAGFTLARAVNGQEERDLRPSKMHLLMPLRMLVKHISSAHHQSTVILSVDAYFLARSPRL